MKPVPFSTASSSPSSALKPAFRIPGSTTVISDYLYNAKLAIQHMAEMPNDRARWLEVIHRLDKFTPTCGSWVLSGPLFSEAARHLSSAAKTNLALAAAAAHDLRNLVERFEEPQAVRLANHLSAQSTRFYGQNGLLESAQQLFERSGLVRKPARCGQCQACVLGAVSIPTYDLEVQDVHPRQFVHAFQAIRFWLMAGHSFTALKALEHVRLAMLSRDAVRPGSKLIANFGYSSAEYADDSKALPSFITRADNLDFNTLHALAVTMSISPPNVN